MTLSYLSEDISSVSEVTAAIESVQKHNMAKLLNDLERRKVHVNFGDLPPETQSIVRDMVGKKHWCTRALSAIITHIPL